MTFIKHNLSRTLEVMTFVKCVICLNESLFLLECNMDAIDLVTTAVSTSCFFSVGESLNWLFVEYMAFCLTLRATHISGTKRPE